MSHRRAKSQADRKIPIEPLLGARSSDEFAFMCATMAWKDGKTANYIARKIFSKSDPSSLMAVKHALMRAHKMGMLRLFPPAADELCNELDKCVNLGDSRKISLHVVPDFDPHLSGAGVYARAAELAGKYIADATWRNLNRARDTNDTVPINPAEVVICNAGGRTAAETVKALVRNPPVLAGTDDEQKLQQESLLFVAANAGYHPECFHRSANFLSVTLAELMSARHFALPRMEVNDLALKHRQRIERTALFICGAGVCHHGQNSGLMAEYFDEKQLHVPHDAVGDIAFNLLDKDGKPVDLPPSESAFVKQLNPTLDLTSLMHIASTNKVLLILDSENPVLKADIAIAILKRRYATDIVLGTRLAKAIIDKLKLEPLCS